MLLILILFTVLLGLYPAPLLDGLHYNAYNLIFNYSTPEDIEYSMGETILNEVFDQFEFNIGQVNYTDLDDSRYVKLADHLNKYYKIN